MKPNDLAKRRLRLFSAAASQEEALNWLWPGYLPKGKLSIIEGDPEKGKGLISIDLAARITRGDTVPLGDRKLPVGRVLITPGEDGWEDTIIPRLIAAGARLDRVLKLQHENGEQFLFPRDLNALGEYIERTNALNPKLPVRLIEIDPLNQHIEDYNSPVKLRKHLTALGDLGNKLGAVIVIVRHYKKDDTGAKAIYRGSGYIDISGAARSVLQVWDVPDKDGLRALAPAKENLGERPLTLLYGVEGVPAKDRSDDQLYDDRGEPVTIGRIVWKGTSKLTPNQLMRGEKASRKAEAERWLEETLAIHGPMLRKDIEDLAKKAGFTWSTVRDASGNIEALCKVDTPTYPKQSAWYLSSQREAPTEEQLRALVEAAGQSGQIVGHIDPSD